MKTCLAFLMFLSASQAFAGNVDGTETGTDSGTSTAYAKEIIIASGMVGAEDGGTGCYANGNDEDGHANA